MKLIIDGELPGLNEYIDALKTSKYKGNVLKQDTDTYIMWQIKAQRLQAIKIPVTVNFKWINKDVKRDLDNIASAKKFIFDALVKMGVLQNDTQRWVKGFTDTFEINKLRPRVEVEITEVEKEKIEYGQGNCD
jgi:Holliday junction resolvase RusA-like endonuclease